MTASASDVVWIWDWIHWKVDLISFPTSTRTSQSKSVWSHGGHHKLVLCCSPNPANASPFPFRSSPWFLMKIRVHVSPRSKHDGQELKKELTWWLSWRARARVRGLARGTGIGVDASLVLKSSSEMGLILVSDRCTVCLECTTGTEIF
jgi:hypothetical protein